MTRRARIQAACAAIQGLELTASEVCILLNSAATVPFYWRPSRAADAHALFDMHAIHYPRTRLHMERGTSEGLYGWATKHHGQYHVHVACDLPHSVMVETLIHELAHVSSWSHEPDHDHGPHWGIEYARAYGAIMEDAT